MQRVDVTYSLITNPAKTKVLMVKNVGDAGDFRWSLPGGAVEADETLEQAAVREAKEETGLDVHVFGIVAIRECKFRKSQHHAVFYTFRAEVIGGEETIQRPDEIAEIAWMDIEQADALMPFYDGRLHRLIAGYEIPYVNEGIK